MFARVSVFEAQPERMEAGVRDYKERVLRAMAVPASQFSESRGILIAQRP